MTGGHDFACNTVVTLAFDAGAPKTTFFFILPDESPSLLRFLLLMSSIVRWSVVQATDRLKQRLLCLGLGL